MAAFLLLFQNGTLLFLDLDFQGDRVFGLAEFGGFAEEVIVEQSVSSEFF